ERDLATKDSPQGFGGHRSDRSAAQLGWPPGLGHSSGNDPSLTSRANTRVGKANGSARTRGPMTGSACPPFAASNVDRRWARRNAPLPTLVLARDVRLGSFPEEWPSPG